MEPFHLERYFVQHEFRIPDGLLCCSDAEAVTLKELLEMADPQCRNLYDELTLSYTETQGHSLLREEVRKLHSDYISRDDILMVVPEEGIFIAMSCLVEEGDEVIAISPCYQSLSQIAKARKCVIKEWKWQLQGGSKPEWVLDLAWLRANMTNRTKLIVINFPHNPTGASLPRAQYHEIFAIAAANHISTPSTATAQQAHTTTYIFSDEIYRFMELNDEPLPAACDVYPNAVTMSGLSKSFGVPGLRVGWLCTQNKSLMTRFREFKDYTTICGSAPSEILAVIALRNKDRLVRRSMDIIRHNLSILPSFFAKHQHIFQWIPPTGSAIAFPRLVLPGWTIDQFCEDLMQKAQIMLLPSSVYGTENHFRFGFGRRNMPILLAKLDKYLASYFPPPASS